MSLPQLYLKSQLLLAQDSSVLVVASIFHCKSETMKDKLKFMRVTAKRLGIFRSHVYLCKLTKAKVFCVFDAKDGVVTYLSKFLPQFNIVWEPPRCLTDCNSVFDWLPQHDDTFCKVKELITKATVLRYLDVNKEVTIECDVFNVGLGAACPYTRWTPSSLSLASAYPNQVQLCSD